MGKRNKPSSKRIFMSLGFLLKIGVRIRNKGALCEQSGSRAEAHFEFLQWSIVFETCFMFQTGGPDERVLIMARKPRRQEAVGNVLLGLRWNRIDSGPLNGMFTAAYHVWMMLGMWRSASRQMTSYNCSTVMQPGGADSARIRNYDKWIKALANGSISLSHHLNICCPMWSITALTGTGRELGSNQRPAPLRECREKGDLACLKVM